MSQVQYTDKTCHNAVSRIIAPFAGSGEEIPSEDTSAYCQARKRLPERLLEKLFAIAGEDLEKKVTDEYLWCGRHVKVIERCFHTQTKKIVSNYASSDSSQTCSRTKGKSRT